MPVRGDPDSLLVGRHVNFVDDVRSTLRQAAADRFDFVSIPLAAPQGQGIGCDFQPSVESCFSLEGEQWRTVVVGRVSDSLDPDTAATFAEAEVLRSQLETELRWAAHLGLQYAILPPPHAALGTGTSRSSCGYARAVGDLLAGGLFLWQRWRRLLQWHCECQQPLMDGGRGIAFERFVTTMHSCPVRLSFPLTRRATRSWKDGLQSLFAV